MKKQLHSVNYHWQTSRHWVMRYYAKNHMRYYAKKIIFLVKKSQVLWCLEIHQQIDCKMHLIFPICPSHLFFLLREKSFLKKSLPSPKRNLIIIEEFSQAVSLMYRMQKKKKVVMYISNMNAFNQNPYEYVLRELFYWFYEEIADDLHSKLYFAMSSH